MTDTRTLVAALDALRPLLAEFDAAEDALSAAHDRENEGGGMVPNDTYYARDDAAVEVARATADLVTAALAALARPIYIAEGEQAYALLRELGAEYAGAEVYRVRVTLHNGIMVKINEGGWSQPYGHAETKR